jgi:copper chaperone CopZ
MKKVILDVKDIMCNGCENEIRNAFKGMNGIIEVEPSHKTKTVTVKYDELKTGIPDIKNTNEKTNRNVTGYKEIE